MRNLKKVLALVLSLVMALSMVTIAGAYSATPGTSFTDDASITEFDEAIQVLAGLGVLQGRETGKLDPNAVITRAEAATIIYRAITGDTDGSDLPIFADNQFSDVKHTDWYAGAVSYAANHGIIKGYEDGSFRPNDSVTGYQAMAILLRSLGYDNGNKFTGATWQTETARYGTLTGISNSLNNAALRLPASRAVVAEIVFRSIAKTSTVKSNAFGTNEPTNVTKGYEVFGLYGDPTVELVSTREGSTAGNEIRTYGHIAEMKAVVPLTGATTYTSAALAKMTNRLDATIDLEAERYGAPVAVWYLDGANRDGATGFDSSEVLKTDPDRNSGVTFGGDARFPNTLSSAAYDGEIRVYFNPASTYTAAVTTGTLYADAVAAGAPTVINLHTPDSHKNLVPTTDPNYVDQGHVVDGVLHDLSTLDNNGGVVEVDNTIFLNRVGSDTVLHTGKGVLTDLYVVPSVSGGSARVFLTSRYTYAARVANIPAADRLGNITLNLTDGGTTNELVRPVKDAAGTAFVTLDPLTATTYEVYTATAPAARYADIALNDVVIYSKYGADVDRFAGFVDTDGDGIAETNVTGYDDFLIASLGAGVVDTVTANLNGRVDVDAPLAVDALSVKEPSSKVMEVTNSYIPNNNDVTGAYFRTAEGRFDYDASYGSSGTAVHISAAQGVVGGSTFTNWYNLTDTDLVVSQTTADTNGTINDNGTPGDDTVGSLLNDLMLDREELVRGRVTQQTVYFDDYGYVVYSVKAGSTVSGYMVLTEGTYAAKDRDNLFYGNYAGFKSDAEAFSVQGGWLTSYYNTQAEASDALALNQGIYFYQKDVTDKYFLNSNDVVNFVTGPSGLRGNVSLLGTVNDAGNNTGDIFTAVGAETVRDIADPNAVNNEYNLWLTDAGTNSIKLGINSILAGDVDALVDGTVNTNMLLDDNTVFVVAEYNQYGAITGYKTYEGIKNIPDLYDGEYYGANNVRVPFLVHYTAAVDTDAAIDLVMVLGAVGYADSVETLRNEQIFFLADTTPDEKFTEFDRHDIFIGGQASTLDFVNETVRTSAGVVNYPVDIYTVEARRGGLVARLASVPSYLATYAGNSMLGAVGSYPGFDGLLSTDPGATPEADLDNDYIVMADDCKIYRIDMARGTSTEITEASLLSTNALDGVNDRVWVGAYNQYGFATVLYIAYA